MNIRRSFFCMWCSLCDRQYVMHHVTQSSRSSDFYANGTATSPDSTDEITRSAAANLGVWTAAIFPVPGDPTQSCIVVDVQITLLWRYFENYVGLWEGIRKYFRYLHQSELIYFEAWVKLKSNRNSIGLYSHRLPQNNAISMWNNFTVKHCNTWLIISLL